jgi:hypothetical protein
MPSYLRLLTEKASEITTPPTGHTAVWTSSGESTYDQYDLYIKNPEGFIYKLGGTGGTVSYGNSTFYSGLTVYSGGYTSSGAPTVALVVDGDISATTSGATLYINEIAGSSPINLNAPYGAYNPNNGNNDHTARFNVNNRTGTNWYGAHYMAYPHSDNGITVHIPKNFTGLTHAITLSGSMSGTNSVAYGLNQTSNHGFAMSGTALYTAVFNSGNTVSNSGATAFGSGNTSSGPVSFSMGGGNTASGEVSFASGSGNTSSGKLSFAGGINNTSSGLASVTLGTGNTASADYSFAFGEDNTVSISHASAFGQDNTISTTGFRGFAANFENTVTGRNSSAFGSGNTASGTTHFVVGSNNLVSESFVVGGNVSGTDGKKGNIITTRQSGVTISMSSNTSGLPGLETNGTNHVSSLTVLSGTGSQPLGFKLPLIELQATGSQPNIATPGSALNSWTTLTGSTDQANKGLMFWDGSNVRVYTGATFPYYATLAAQGDGGSF